MPENESSDHNAYEADEYKNGDATYENEHKVTERDVDIPSASELIKE